MKTVKQLHAEWANRIIPKDAPQVQRQEMERAFYSGAFAVFSLQLADVAALPDDKAEEAMDKIYNELMDYFKMMLAIPRKGGVERS
jgi:hypothetical protein